MMEIDDKILKLFFQENKKEIADGGFTHRVIKGLPDRKMKLAGIISAVFLTAVLVLFLLLDGFNIILNAVGEIFVSAIDTGVTHLDLTTLLIIAGVLLFWGVRKIYSTE